MMLARLLLILLLALPVAVNAADSAQTVLHMLDYVSVDYPEFVKGGKVLDEAEYKEQQEFSAQVVALIGKLAAIPQRAALLEQAHALERLIDDKAAGAEVAKRASDLRWRVIEAYDIAVAPKRAPNMIRGAGLYAAQCAVCHGKEGRSDGPAARGLDPAPSNFHDHARMAQRSLYGLYSTITLGVEGTAMRPFPQLSEEERWALAFYVGSLGADPERLRRGHTLWQQGVGKSEVGSLHAVATLDEREATQRYGADVAAALAWLKANPSDLPAEKESPIAFSRRVLAESIAAYRAGRRDEAQRLALASYLEGFELAEASLDAIDRNLREEVETQMIAYRDLMRRGAPPQQVAQQGERIDQLLAAAGERLGAGGMSPTTAAISAFFILLREGLEALLVVAAIVAFLRKAGRPEALAWIHAGWIGALALGAVTWFVAATLIEVSGATRELTEGVTALFAAAILLYVGVWLHSKSYAHAWKAFIEQHLRSALQHGALWALAGVSFLAVYREAFETVLFYQALWQQAGHAARAAVLMGFASAVVALVVIAWLILRYTVRLPIGLFFGLSSVLLALLAVIFTGHGVKALQEAGLIAATPLGGVNLPALGIYPTAQTLAAQAVVLAAVLVGFGWSSISNRRRIAARAS